MTRTALVDISKSILKVLEVDWDGERLVLKGGCKRCGKCCQIQIPPCEHLIFDSREYEGGPLLASCALQYQKPVRCAIEPLPTDPYPEGCGFRWEPKG